MHVSGGDEGLITTIY